MFKKVYFLSDATKLLPNRAFSKPFQEKVKSPAGIKKADRL